MAHRFYNKSKKTVVLGGRRFAPGAMIDYKPDVLPPVILGWLKDGTLEEASKTIKTKGAAVAAKVAAPTPKAPAAPVVDEPKAEEPKVEEPKVEEPKTETKPAGKGRK